tara:strand:+ start:2638 stop:3996 length:1359 start_codon:yes stop_codon:yes gene_type:complete
MVNILNINYIANNNVSFSSLYKVFKTDNLVLTTAISINNFYKSLNTIEIDLHSEFENEENIITNTIFDITDNSNIPQSGQISIDNFFFSRQLKCLVYEFNEQNVDKCENLNIFDKLNSAEYNDYYDIIKFIIKSGPEIIGTNSEGALIIDLNSLKNKFQNLIQFDIYIDTYITGKHGIQTTNPGSFNSANGGNGANGGDGHIAINIKNSEFLNSPVELNLYSKGIEFVSYGFGSNGGNGGNGGRNYYNLNAHYTDPGSAGYWTDWTNVPYDFNNHILWYKANSGGWWYMARYNGIGLGIEIYNDNTINSWRDGNREYDDWGSMLADSSFYITVYGHSYTGQRRGQIYAIRYRDYIPAVAPSGHVDTVTELQENGTNGNNASLPIARTHNRSNSFNTSTQERADNGSPGYGMTPGNYGIGGLNGNSANFSNLILTYNSTYYTSGNLRYRMVTI